MKAYSEFLELTHKATKTAVKTYNQDEANWRERSYAFGGYLSAMIDHLGEVSPKAEGLRRLILI